MVVMLHASEGPWKTQQRENPFQDRMFFLSSKGDSLPRFTTLVIAFFLAREQSFTLTFHVKTFCRLASL